jgi:hypothetical protein
LVSADQAKPSSAVIPVPSAYFATGDKWAGELAAGTSGNRPLFTIGAADEEEAYMPVLLLWAVPTVIVIGGVGYYFLRVVH